MLLGVIIFWVFFLHIFVDLLLNILVAIFTIAYFGKKSQPCCIREPIANHMQFIKVNCVSVLSGCELQDDGDDHSYGVNLKLQECFNLLR